MIEIIRHDRETLTRTFGCSRRLATRLGALMSKRIAVSATVLEEARPDSILESLLLQQTLLHPIADTDSPQTFLTAQMQTESFAALAQELPLAVMTLDGWAVIVAEEETLAEAGWREAEPFAAPITPDLLPALAPVAGDVARFQSSAAGNAASGKAFTADETARLRVDIFAGVAIPDRIAALRQFAFTDVPDVEKVSVFLQACAFEEAELRAVAAQGLQHFGLAPAVAEAARQLATGNEPAQLTAATRFLDSAHAASDLGKHVILFASIGSLRDTTSPTTTRQAVLVMLAHSAEYLGAERLCRDEVLRPFLDHLGGSNQTVLPELRAALRAFDAVQPGWVATVLIQETQHASEVAYRGQLLEIIAGLPLTETVRAAVVPVAAEVFFAVPCDQPVAHTIGHFLTHTDDAGLQQLAEHVPHADIAHQRHLIRLFDNTLRSREVSDEVRNLIAQSGLLMLQQGPKPVRFDILETRICARDDLAPDLRCRIAEAFLSDFHDYTQWPLSDILHTAFVHLGAPAAAPLLIVLREQYTTPEADIFAASLGAIGASLLATAQPEATAQAENILRELQKLSFLEAARNDALHLAMGMICAQPTGVRGDVARLIYTTLSGRIQGNASDAKTIEALGLVCSGAALSAAEVHTVVALALQHLHHTQPNPTVSVTQEAGEDVFHLGGEVSIYAELIPACLAALEAIALGSGTAEKDRAALTEELLELWGQTARYALIWGPANAARLTVSLGRIGATKQTSPALRISIAHTLAQKIGDLHVLEPLTQILAESVDLPELDRLAGSVALRIMKVLDEADHLTAEDREIYLRHLAQVARRGSFAIRGGGVDRLLERVIAFLLGGLRENILGCHEHLRRLRDSEYFPSAHRTRIRDALAHFRQPLSRP